MTDEDPPADDGAPAGSEDPTGEDGEGVGWPVELGGVTESVVATPGPDDRWNLAALGLRAPDDPDATGADAAGTDATGAAVTARTWGRTRTRRNFERRGGGVVQFTRDPRLFVEAALGIVERKRPVDASADAWARVRVDRIETGRQGDTEWARWRLIPTQAAVVRRSVPTIDRGFDAVVEATVAASRLDVDAYDTDELLDRLAYLSTVVESCGDEREREALDRIDDHVGWTDRE